MFGKDEIPLPAPVERKRSSEGPSQTLALLVAIPPIAGVRLPDIAVPLATYTGWGLRAKRLPVGTTEAPEDRLQADEGRAAGGR